MILTLFTNGAAWPNAVYGFINNAASSDLKVVFAPFDEDGSIPAIPVTDYELKGYIEQAYFGYI